MELHSCLNYPELEINSFGDLSAYRVACYCCGMSTHWRESREEALYEESEEGLTEELV